MPYGDWLYGETCYGESCGAPTNRTAQVLIFDRAGSLLAEIEPDLQSVSWRLNRVGKAKFSMATSDPKCTPDNLRPGNRILISFANGLPAWGGVISLPRRREPGRITVTAYTGEKLLDYRVTAKSRYFDQAQPGYIFQTLIQEANAVWQTGIEIGNVWLGGTPRTIECHYTNILWRIRKLASLTGHDFAILPEYANGTLKFKAYWWERRGDDIQNSVWLIEGANVAGDPILDEQGPIANHVVLAAQGNTWGDERLTATEQDNESINEYGYREYAEVTSVKDQATLDANAEEVLATMAWPRNRITLSATDESPAQFADYDIGDIASVHLFLSDGHWAFDAPVRIIGREWRPDNTCRLEVEEWLS